MSAQHWEARRRQRAQAYREEQRKKAEGAEVDVKSDEVPRIPTKLPNRYTSVAYNQQYWEIKARF